MLSMNENMSALWLIHTFKLWVFWGHVVRKRETSSPLPSLYPFPFAYTFLFSHTSSRGRGEMEWMEDKQVERQVTKPRARERKCTIVVMEWQTEQGEHQEWERQREGECLHTVCICVCFSDMAISRDGCPWTRVCANRYLSLTDRPSTGNYTGRSTAGGTGLSRICINLHVSLGLVAASGTLYESRSHSADNLFKFNKMDGGKVKQYQCSPYILVKSHTKTDTLTWTHTVISLWFLLWS